MKRAISALALIPLAGCVSYVIPEGVPTAMIRFTSNVTSHMVPRCGVHARQVKQGMIGNQFWTEESPVRMHGTQPGKRNDVIERLIPAENEIGFRLNGGTSTGVGTGLGCTIFVAFTPRQGEQYHARFELDSIAKVCTAGVFQLAEKNGKITETPVKARTFKEDLWGVTIQPCT